MPSIAKVYKGAEQIWPSAAAGNVVGFKGVRFSGATSGDNLEWTSDVGTTVSSTATSYYKVEYSSMPYNPVMPLLDTMNVSSTVARGYTSNTSDTADPTPLVVTRGLTGVNSETDSHMQVAVVDPQYGDDYRLESLIVDIDGAILYSDTPGWTVSRTTTGQYDCQAPENWDMLKAIATAYYTSQPTYVYGVFPSCIASNSTGFTRVRVFYATQTAINQPFYLGVLVPNG